MAELDISASSYTNLSDVVPDFIVEAKALDTENAGGEFTYWYFSEATKNFGYYMSIPEIHSAANALATWAFGRGWTAEDPQVKVQLEHLRGLGNEHFQAISWNHEIVKVIVGDAFAKIVMNEDKTVLLNLVPISPERVRVAIKDNQIHHYDVWNSVEWKRVDKEDMLHSSNNRIGDQIHGTSKIDATKWIIDARNEALLDERMIKHRELAMGILYIDSDNETQRDALMRKYEQAVKKGEVLVLPKDTAELKDSPVSPQDRLAWIQYLENFFYQTFGVPRAIATSDGTSEVGGKMGHVIFEPTYTKEQTDYESDLWNQLGIKVTFNRPPSLGGLMQETEAKNTGQLNIQPNDVEATMTRE